MDKMRKRVLLAAWATMAFCSCEPEEKIYTESELGAIIEWASLGWDEIYNNLEGTVTLITTHPDMHSAEPAVEKTSLIPPGGFDKREIGCFFPAFSLSESLTATIRLADGTEIQCTHDADDAWSKRLYETFSQRHEEEIVDFHGKKLRHPLTIVTYHIDDTLVELWRTGNE